MEWKSLTDLIPSKEYVDVIHEEPDENDEEKVDLPTQPDASTIKPVTSWRLRFKQPEPTTSVGDKQHSMDINDYQPRSAQVDVDADLEEDDLGIGDGRTFSVGGSSSARPLLKSSTSRASESVAEEPGEKRQKVTHGEDDSESPDMKDEEAMHAEFFDALDEVNEGYVMELDLDFQSHRDQKNFIRNPVNYLVKKMRDTEVNYRYLSEEDKQLFDRAKSKEVKSFLAQEAVRKCLGRVLGCRWVLTWKIIPPEEQEEAKKALAESSATTTVTKDATKKAKARIVLLGFQHPDLLQEGHKTASPVQSTLARYLTFQLVAQNKWDLEGLDLSTAFLQTSKTMEKERLWTTGTPELKEALGVLTCTSSGLFCNPQQEAFRASQNGCECKLQERSALDQTGA